MPAKRCVETKNMCLLFVDYCTYVLPERMVIFTRLILLSLSSKGNKFSLVVHWTTGYLPSYVDCRNPQLCLKAKKKALTLRQCSLTIGAFRSGTA